MDLVSVIIPYYKKRNFIKETIVSVIKQSYDHLEIIIIYDDTNLNDLEFLKEISKLDNRIKIINNNNRKLVMETVKRVSNQLTTYTLISVNILEDSFG